MNLSDALAARVAKRRETMLAARGWTDAELLAAVDAGATKAELSARFRVTLAVAKDDPEGQWTRHFKPGSQLHR